MNLFLLSLCTLGSDNILILMRKRKPGNLISAFLALGYHLNSE